jgi:hypothetical protein
MKSTAGMALTLEDLDRRLSVLELAQSARGENMILRLEQQVNVLPRVVAGMIAESEKRIMAGVKNSVMRLVETVRANERRIGESEQRIVALVSASEQRMAGAIAGAINDSEQRILAVLDRIENPPKD